MSRGVVKQSGNDCPHLSNETVQCTGTRSEIKIRKNKKLYVDPPCAIPIYNNHIEHPVNHGLDEKFGSVVYRCDNFKQ